jgi:hypothetical protein
MYYAEIRKMSSLTSIQIQALVRDMDGSMRRNRPLKSDSAKYEEKMIADNQTLFNEFPTIFYMHLEGKLDGTFFEMLKLRHKMDKGELTEDEASRIVGQQLFDRYVAPVVENKAAPEKPVSYSDFYKQFDTNACNK